MTQVVGGLAIYCFYFCINFIEAAPLYWQFGRRTHLIGYLNEAAPFYLFMLSKTMLAVGSKGSLVGLSFI